MVCLTWRSKALISLHLSRRASSSLGKSMDMVVDGFEESKGRFSMPRDVGANAAIGESMNQRMERN